MVASETRRTNRYRVGADILGYWDIERDTGDRLPVPYVHVD